MEFINISTEIEHSSKIQLKYKFLSQLFLVLFTIFITIIELVISENRFYNLTSAFVFTLLYLLMIKILKIRIKDLVYTLVSILIAFSLLEIIFYNISSIILFSFIILIISEMIVNITSKSLKKGSRWNKNFISPMIFGIASFILLNIFVFFQNEPAQLNNKAEFYNFLYLILFTSIEIAVILIATYYLTKDFIKYFTIPVILALLIYFLNLQADVNTVHQFMISILLAATFAIFSYKFRFLTLDGAVAQFILASLIFGFGGWKFTLPVVTFFIFSSLLSKLNHKTNAQFFFEKSGVRDSFQVFANGGLGVILLIIYKFVPSELLYWIYVSSFAVVCADTWATEIGTLVKTKTISIITFEKVEQGVSGGISLLGTVGAVLGSFIITLSSLIWVRSNEINFIIWLTIAGFFGSIIDSVIGGSIQAQYKCKICSKITERKNHCNNNAFFIKGLKWLNNDIVNFLSALSGGLMIIFIKEILKA